MNKIKIEILNAANLSLTDEADAKPNANQKRKRKPSESVRLKARLKDLAETGITPHALWFDPEGGFELRLHPEPNVQTDEYEDWFAERIAEEVE
ncbi:hypothetical protein [Hyphobacterium sp.]|uniref:hypothetical protein n=1 Tax=Hyphobacterium sp. TaxID=2004662 RepID=UPI0037498403